MFEVFSEKTRNYLEGEFYSAVKLFNEACGRGLSGKSNEELIQVLKEQLAVVKEETIEAFVAFPYDKKEMLDGVVDMLYTMSWLYEVKDYSAHLDYFDEFFQNHAEFESTIKYIESLVKVFKCVFEDVSKEFDEETIIKACKLICANNSLKYTSDEEEFNTWRIPADCHRVSYTVDGVKYFSIKDATGKTRKHLDFEKVVLDNIII